MSDPVIAPPSAQATATATSGAAASVADPKPQTSTTAAPAPPATPPAGTTATDGTATATKDAAAAKPDATVKEPPAGQPKELTKEDLKLPDGSLLDPKAVDEVVAFAKAQNLSKDAAQKVLERESALRSSYTEADMAKTVELQKGWVSASQNDKEFGGERFGVNAEIGKRVFQRYGSEALGIALEKTGLGNHPELTRFAIRIGKAMSEDQLHIPAGDGGPVKKSAAETLYGDEVKKD